MSNTINTIFPKKLDYCLLITGPAYGNQRASSALQFAEALLNCGHGINTIFFYQDGVYNANYFIAPANDEINLVQSWLKFAAKYKVSLNLCVSAGLRRGITETTQSLQLDKFGDNLQPGFNLSGLSSLAEAILKCDRLIQF
ncbi:sulfurtransferase complex subunit TusD [Candidatus Palibaumannia cicadellinicola]|uniref:tRNA 5-methylaminomethyl-2-thiouridine synthase TusD n=1 Tax=Candidatus Palibaumannia cicadellinicola TaxID=186490 RepID=A0A088MYN7_9GAMM|nr:sulfurtransferase complex subunit TusD [Candidatus Baumannia cicadellinicola]AIN47407.1 tRNA 5-methylaminomethyl-2-thiouridine synthase TusD [Candidatus Baumannia cicadellinicola]